MHLFTLHTVTSHEVIGYLATTIKCPIPICSCRNLREQMKCTNMIFGLLALAAAVMTDTSAQTVNCTTPEECLCDAKKVVE